MIFVILVMIFLSVFVFADKSIVLEKIILGGAFGLIPLVSISIKKNTSNN